MIQFSASRRLRGENSLLPPYGSVVLGVLLIQPLLQRSKVIEDRGRISLALAGQNFHRVLPGLARAHGQHLVELGSRGFVAVDGAAVERPGVASLFAQGALKLEL